MDPLTARRTWRTPEMIHGFVYFAPEPTQAYAALGLSGSRRATSRRGRRRWERPRPSS